MHHIDPPSKPKVNVRRASLPRGGIFFPEFYSSIIKLSLRHHGTRRKHASHSSASAAVHSPPLQRLTQLKPSARFGQLAVIRLRVAWRPVSKT